MKKLSLRRLLIVCNNRFLFKDIMNSLLKVREKWERHLCEMELHTTRNSSKKDGMELRRAGRQVLMKQVIKM
jgi:hypothetical protein